MLSVVTPAARRSLTTSSRYRAAMPETAVDDDGLERLIRRCTAIIESYCGRTFARERVVERITTRPAGSLVLTRTPVVELYSITRDGEPVADCRLDSAGVVHFPPAESFEELWLLLGGPRLGDTLSDRPRAHTVEYTGGYLVPDGDSDGDLPPDLEHACHLVVRGELDLRARGALGLAAERLGEATRIYVTGGAPRLDVAQGMLDAHRRALP